MNLTEASMMARKLMNSYGLGHVPFEFDRAKNRLGATHVRTMKVGGVKKVASVQKITLSTYFVEANDAAKVQNTILHEIAHALCPVPGHGPEWRMKARALGIKPERCFAGAVMPKDHPWEGRCMKCNSLSGQQHRAPLRVYACTKCKGPFNERVLIWTKNGQRMPLPSMPQRFRNEVHHMKTQKGYTLPF